MPGDGRRQYVWWWRCRLPERKGERCEVLARGRMNSVLVRFADGELVVTSRWAIRKEKEKDDESGQGDRGNGGRD